ncbi:hypothetical protein BT96DRAFT_1010137 [Gymnopus androsaceus JB14]|uniref:Uncharacterized protein n=1 Tax=Gymnopus androsaceus JB14 TaxID=1447944 RepID=A0A6A4GB59_9AGAR|nr:hypothetical protein BT96DRAFT_1010137 [Gymnopus androsaceus JB14]
MTSQKAARGRTKGAKMYGTSELVKLVELTKAMLPLAGKGWTVVAEKYNKWVVNHNLPDRKTKALRNKFDVILNQAMDQPTGKGEHRQISDKKGSKDSSDSDDDVQLISAKLTTKKGTILTKLYKTEAALPSCAASCQNQANTLMEWINSSLDPNTQCKRDEECSMSSFQVMMLQNMQNQFNALQTQLNEEQCQADIAENNLQMERLLHCGSWSHCYRHCHHSSPTPSPSPPKSHRCRCSYSPTPSPRKSRNPSQKNNPRHSHSPQQSSADFNFTSHEPIKVDAAESNPSDALPTMDSSSRANLEALAGLASQLPPIPSNQTLNVRQDSNGWYNIDNH